MVLLDSSLLNGRVTRDDLRRHLEPQVLANIDMLCALSASDLQMFVAPCLINVGHINSCLQRTMMKRWVFGFLQTNRKQGEGAQAPRSPPLTKQGLIQLEKRRLSFTQEYRQAYLAVSNAAEKLETLAEAQRKAWDLLSLRERHKAIIMLHQRLLKHFDAASDLVLKLLPAQTFLDMYNHEDTCQPV